MLEHRREDEHHHGHDEARHRAREQPGADAFARAHAAILRSQRSKAMRKSRIGRGKIQRAPSAAKSNFIFAA